MTKNRREFSSFIFLYMFFMLSASAASDMPIIDLDSHKSGDSTVDQYQYYVANTTENLALADVLKLKNWIQPQIGEVTHGFSDSPSWMRFVLANPSEQLKDLIIEYVDASVETIDLYYRQQGSNNNFEHLNFSFNKAVSSRPVPFYRPAFPLKIPASQRYEIYIRIFQGNDFPMHSFTSMRIWEVKTFYGENHHEMLLLIILLCTEMFMCIATLIAFTATRDTVFLYYAGFAFSAFLLFAGNSGLWSYFIVKEGFELWMVVLQISLCQISAILFVRRFLNIKKYLPRTDTLLLVIVWVDIVGVMFNLLGSPYLSRIIIDYTAFAYLLLLVVGLYAHKKGVPHALLFTSSWVVFIVGMAMSSLRYRGYVADSIYTEWLIYLGGFIEAFLLTTVMALRIRDLLQEKQHIENKHKNHLENSALELSKKVYQQTKLLEQAKNKAEQEARTDMLTGLINRRSFFELAQSFVERATHPKKSNLYLLSLDIDHFKAVNDTYGHAAGDVALVEVARAIQRVLRSEDIVARLGGEEFAVVIEQDSPAVLDALCERLRLDVETLQICFNGNQIPLTISIGVVNWTVDIPWDVFMQQSDQALYQAKNQGRNCVVYYQESTS